MNKWERLIDYIISSDWEKGLEKLVVSSCYSREREKLDPVVSAQIKLITGQKPIMVRCRKAVSNFKTRMGLPIGYKVTLRRRSAYNFLRKLFLIVIVKDVSFSGMHASNFSRRSINLGLDNMDRFPEIVASNDLLRSFTIGCGVSIVWKRPVALEEFKDNIGCLVK